MKILLITDIHSDYVAAKSVYDVEKPDFILDCGDHDELRNLFDFSPHFYIYGNHEPFEIKVLEDNMPLPSKIEKGQIIKISNAVELRVAGLDGNYSNSDKSYSVNKYNVEGLKSIPERGIEILLTHESPLLISPDSRYREIAEKVLYEIDRIKPRFVFSGHAGFYKCLRTSGGVENIILEPISKGYCVLDGKTFELRRERARFC